MLSQRFVGAMLVVGASVGVLVCGAASARAVCTQITHGPRPAVCPICHPGPCMCVPNAYWGYYPRQWRPWPGDSVRQNIVFPQSLAVEPLARPRGTKPRPLPKEKYGKPKRVADRTIEIEIREGAPVERVETPKPLQYRTDWWQSFEGPELGPQRPATK